MKAVLRTGCFEKNHYGLFCSECSANGVWKEGEKMDDNVVFAMFIASRQTSFWTAFKKCKIFAGQKDSALRRTFIGVLCNWGFMT